MSSTKSKKKHRARTQRYTSNVFAMFNQAQIQEFKVISVFDKLVSQSFEGGRDGSLAHYANYSRFEMKR